MKTIIERKGHEFELPEGHSAKVFAGHAGPETYVRLDSGVAASVYKLTVERRGDATVFRLGDELAESGEAMFVDGTLVDATGYPLPDAAV
jgi:hypothetical protein